MEKDRTYWLQGYEGTCKQGALYRSDIAAVIKLQETHIDGHVVGIKVSEKMSNKPDYTIQFIVSIDNVPTTYENRKEMNKQFNDKYNANEITEGKLYNKED